MFETLPSGAETLKILLRDLHDDLIDRAERLRLLLAIEYDFGSEKGLMLPGGTPAQVAYVETRQAFVYGNFLSVILLSQCVLENTLAAYLGLDFLSKEIRGDTSMPQKDRPMFKDTIIACRKIGIIDDVDARDLARLSGLRNALAHFRAVSDPTHLDRRSIREQRPAAEICAEDAQFAIGLFIRMLSKSAFRFERDP